MVPSLKGLGCDYPDAEDAEDAWFSLFPPHIEFASGILFVLKNYAQEL